MRLTGYRLLPLSVTALLLAACGNSNVVSKPVVEATAGDCAISTLCQAL